MRIENEAIAIDTVAKSVNVRRADGSTYTESYDKLLLSPGASPCTSAAEGHRHRGDLHPAQRRRYGPYQNYVTSRTVASAVVVGAGFIGLEMAENLHRAGAGVSIVEMGNQVMAPVDFSIASHVHQHLLQGSAPLFSSRASSASSAVATKSGSFSRREEYDDRPELSFRLASVPKPRWPKQPESGSADRRHLGGRLSSTSAEDVYAVGDAIEFPHPLTGKPWLNYLANPANRQGASWRTTWSSATRPNTKVR